MKNIFKKIAVLIHLVLATTFASASTCGVFGDPQIIAAKVEPFLAYECGPRSYINDTERKVLIVTDKSYWEDVNEEEFELVAKWLGFKGEQVTPSILIIDYSKANIDRLRAMWQVVSSTSSPEEADQVMLTLAKADLSNKNKKGEIK